MFLTAYWKGKIEIERHSAGKSGGLVGDFEEGAIEGGYCGLCGD